MAKACDNCDVAYTPGENECKGCTFDMPVSRQENRVINQMLGEFEALSQKMLDQWVEVHGKDGVFTFLPNGLSAAHQCILAGREALYAASVANADRGPWTDFRIRDLDRQLRARKRDCRFFLKMANEHLRQVIG